MRLSGVAEQAYRMLYDKSQIGVVLQRSFDNAQIGSWKRRRRFSWQRLSQGEPDPELLKLVDAYAKMDGSPERMTEAMMLMGKFCQQSRKAAE
jgi:hypothetical protein